VIHVAMPTGDFHGWGVCGTQLLKHIPGATPIEDFEFPLIVGNPVLQAIQGVNLLPLRPNISSSVANIGYAFIEDDELVKRYVPNGERYFDHIVGGSRWCAQILRNAGLKNVSDIPQGVDYEQFSAFTPANRTRYRDDFVIYSGGKIEYRKGTDLVIEAVRVMMQRHDNVRLLPMWYNPWPETMKTLAQSRLELNLSLCTNSPYACVNFIHDTLHRNGIPLDRVIPIRQVPNGAAVAEYIHNCDVGLFASRCEGGTNLGLMETLACGIPCIASNNTGHEDVIDEGVLPLYKQTPVLTSGVHTWYESDVEEMIEALEWCYRHRGDAEYREMGDLARQWMRLNFTWDGAAKQFMDIARVCARTSEEGK